MKLILVVMIMISDLGFNSIKKKPIAKVSPKLFSHLEFIEKIKKIVSEVISNNFMST